MAACGYYQRGRFILGYYNIELERQKEEKGTRVPIPINPFSSFPGLYFLLFPGIRNGASARSDVSFSFRDGVLNRRRTRGTREQEKRFGAGGIPLRL